MAREAQETPEKVKTVARERLRHAAFKRQHDLHRYCTTYETPIMRSERLASEFLGKSEASSAEGERVK
jgi:hypothetical protein